MAAGVRFRGSVGTWKNLYLMVDYGSTDIDLTGTVTNYEYRLRARRLRTSSITRRFAAVSDSSTRFGYNTDIFGELTYDSLDFDFGSFAGENFDMDRQEIGGTLGVRTMFGDDFAGILCTRGTRALGDADLTTGIFDTDTLFGVGFAWQVIRGLSLVGDYESGEFSSWSVGFRLDLDED